MTSRPPARQSFSFSEMVKESPLPKSQLCLRPLPPPPTPAPSLLQCTHARVWLGCNSAITPIITINPDSHTAFLGFPCARAHAHTQAQYIHNHHAHHDDDVYTDHHPHHQFH